MQINRSALAAALAAARGIAPTRTPRPHLQEALLYEAFGSVHLAATDLARGLDLELTGDAEAGETIMLPLADAAAALATLDGDRVAVTAKDGRTTLAGGDASWTWSASDPTDATCHRGPTAPLTKVLSVPSAALAEALRRVEWARVPDREEVARYALHHVRLAVERERATLTAASGATLATDGFAAPGATASVAATLDPTTLAAILATASAETVDVHCAGERAEVRAPRARGWLLGLTLPFPNTAGMTTTKGEATCVVTTKDLLRAVGRANLATDNLTQALEVTLTGERLGVKHANAKRSADGGGVAARAVTASEPIAFHVSGEHLARALRASPEEVRLWFPIDQGPLILRSEAWPDWTALVMPIRMEG